MTTVLKKKSSPHYHGHRQRLRTRLLESKKNTLPDYEIIELLLAMAKPRGDVKPLAKELLERFGTFARVIHATPEMLKDIPGVGEAVMATFRVVQEATARMVREEVLEKPALESWKALLDYCRLTMGHISTEQFRILYLDKRNCVLADDLQELGTVDHTVLYPREVIKRAFSLEATAIILIHNHPSGNTRPSRADIQLTESLMKALTAVNINLLDHVIISHESHYSFKTHGLL